MLPDSPINNRFLNEREKFIAVMRIKDNMTGTESRVSLTRMMVTKLGGIH
jgi:hypothetical protein